MTPTAWLFVATVIAVLIGGVAMEAYQRRLDRQDWERRHEHRQLMDEVHRQPPSDRIEPIERRRP